MTARETIEAELKQMVFDLLHEQDMDDLRDGEKKALPHISAAEQAHILDSTQSTAWRNEIEKAATFSRLLKGDAEP
jgi:hypothetical protein